MHRPLPLPPWPEMESTTNAEFRGFDSHSSDEQQQLADQYRTMRELLKIYGVNVAESPQNSLIAAEEKNHGGGKSIAISLIGLYLEFHNVREFRNFRTKFSNGTGA